MGEAAKPCVKEEYIPVWENFMVINHSITGRWGCVCTIYIHTMFINLEFYNSNIIQLYISSHICMFVNLGNTLIN